MLRLNDVRLRGCGFTLFPAANELGVSEALVYDILRGIYEQVGAINEDFEQQEKIRKENPEFPQVLHENSRLSQRIIKKALNANLLKEVYGGYVLTDKCIKVFEKASTIQRKRDSEGFHVCLCTNY